MKHIFTILFSISILCAYSQHYETFYMEDLSSGSAVHYCTVELSGVLLLSNCEENEWYLALNGNFIHEENMDSILIEMPITQLYIGAYYDECNISIENISFEPWGQNYIPNPFPDTVLFKRQFEIVSLGHNNAWGGHNYYWSTGETTSNIEVIEPGMYTVTIENPCTSATYSVEVRDNVEAYRATVDLRTNKNKVTWQVTPEQAEYITDVKVYRDDVLVGTAPYTNGYFLDAIGSDAAARNYRIVGVAIEGDDCPIPSYEKGTIHTTYYEDVDGNLNMTWNTPYIEEGAQGTLTGYQICKYNPATEEVTVVDQVNASITDYTCNTAAFTGGQATIAAIFDSKDVEDRAFSNLTDHTFAVCEENETNFMVYPNPSNGTFIVEGNGLLSIRNVLGQEIMTKEIEDKINLELPKGIYFLKMNGRTQKVVVE